MVIRYDELENKIKDMDKTKVEALESKIDNALLDSYGNGSSVTIGITNLDLPRQYVMNDLFSQYRQAGWEVKYNSDQRDGDYLSVQPVKSQANSSSEYYFNR